MIRNNAFLKFIALFVFLICLLSANRLYSSTSDRKVKDYITQINNSKNSVEAEEIAKKAFADAQINSNLAGKAEIYLALGELYYNQAHPTLPKTYFDSAFEIANELKSPILLLKSHRNIARVYNKEGQYHLAVEHFIKSLDIARKLHLPGYIFTNYVSLSISYNDQNKPDQSLIYSTVALGDSLSIPKRDKAVTLSSLYMCIGRSYWLKKDMKVAELYTQKAISLSKDDDVRLIKTRGWAYSNLGDIYQSEKKYEKALTAYNSALKTFGLMGGDFGFQRIFISMSKTFYSQGKIDESLLLALKANKLAKKVNIWLDIKESSMLISDIYSKKKEYDKAYAYHLEYTAAKDSLERIEHEGKIVEIQTLYETKEKDNLIGLQQIRIEANNSTLAKNRAERKFLIALVISISTIFLALLVVFIYISRKNRKIREQQTIIEQTNNRLEEQKANLEQINQAKNRLFSIIGHDLISQVGTTKEFLSLMTNRPEDFENFAKRKEILEALYSTSTSTFTLLENLLIWSRNERGLISFIPLNQDLMPIIQEAVDGFKFQAKKKSISIELVGNQNVKASFDQNIIATVLRNLIANAIKFSHVGGQVIVKLTEAPLDVYVSVSDTGVGISPETIKAILESHEVIPNVGTENEKGNGLGLSLCQDLIIMHGKKLEIFSIEGQGTTFSFSLSK